MARTSDSATICFWCNLFRAGDSWHHLEAVHRNAKGRLKMEQVPKSERAETSRAGTRIESTGSTQNRFEAAAGWE